MQQVGLSGHESEKYDLEAQCHLHNDTDIKDLYTKVDGVMSLLYIKPKNTETTLETINTYGTGHVSVSINEGV